MDGVKYHCAAYMVPSLVLGDGVLLSRNVLHSTVQYKIQKKAVLGGSCSSVSINALCPASLGSILMGDVGDGGNGHDQISWPVNLAMFLDRCDSAV